MRFQFACASITSDNLSVTARTRITKPRAVSTTCEGSAMTDSRNLRNSILASSAPPVASGQSKAIHALIFQARHVITIYASFASKVSHGIRIACTPFFVCSIKFSWLHLSFDSRIT